MDDMAERLARLALFSDLTTPQLAHAAHAFEEEMFPEGQRILRQGFTGSNLYVILDGEACITVDGKEIARLGRGEFFGEISALLGEPPAGGQGLPRRQPPGHVSHAPGRGPEALDDAAVARVAAPASR